MDGLNMQTIKDVIVTLPPLNIQKQFKKCLCLFSATREGVLQSLLKGANELQASLTYRAFRGDL